MHIKLIPKLILIAFMSITILFITNGCQITQQDVPDIVQKMFEAQKNINTLQYKVTGTYQGESTDSITTYYIDKISKRMKSITTSEDQVWYDLRVEDKWYRVIDHDEDEFDSITRSFCEGISAFEQGGSQHRIDNIENQIRKYSQVEVVSFEQLPDERESVKISIGKGKNQFFLWIDPANYLVLQRSNPSGIIRYYDYRINEPINDNIFDIPEGQVTEERPCS